MTRLSIRCPDCGNSVDLIGFIPSGDVFAGRVMERPLNGGQLYRCRNCSLGFRWPQLSKRELDSLYEQGDKLAWSAPKNSRKDWRTARDWIRQSLPVNNRILDVGCFAGGFLEPLVESYSCFGIEINSSARRSAERKGIEIIGDDFAAIAGGFDCITAFDVIEHIKRPRAFLNDCLKAVNPGGWVIISTGNLDAFAFRLMGSRYWYCAIAEHVSFISPEWYARLDNQNDCRMLKQITFSHSNSSRSRQIRETLANLLYRIAPPVFRLLRKLGVGCKNPAAHPELADHPPGWMSARDHFMVLIQKR